MKGTIASRVPIMVDWRPISLMTSSSDLASFSRKRQILGTWKRTTLAPYRKKNQPNSVGLDMAQSLPPV
jgi:hypothetical protein